MAIGVAIGVAVVACVLALIALLRRPVRGRHAVTMELSLTLLRYDEGLGRLAAQTRRAERWWDDVDPMEQHHIDRALSMWDMAAWYVATGRVERGAFLEVFRWDIVDLWERAYPYVLHRRVDQPSLWPSLTDLYMDAYEDTAGATRPRHEPHTFPQRSVSPEGVSDVEDDESVQPSFTVAPVTVSPPAEAPAPVTVAPVAAAAVTPATVASVEAPLPPEEPVVPEIQPVPHPPVRAADVGWVPPSEEEVAPATDPWTKALRKAGPVSRPYPARRPSLLPPVRQVPEMITEEWQVTPAGRPTRPASEAPRATPSPAPRPTTRPTTRSAQRPAPAAPSLEVDQVIALTEAQTLVRSVVGG